MPFFLAVRGCAVLRRLAHPRWANSFSERDAAHLSDAAALDAGVPRLHQSDPALVPWLGLHAVMLGVSKTINREGYSGGSWGGFRRFPTARC